MKTESGNSSAPERRDFITLLGKLALAASLAPAFAGSCANSNPIGGDLSGNTITLDLTLAENSALQNVGGAIKISDPNDTERPMIVSRIHANEAAAFSSRCAHLGCEVPLPTNNLIVCPCHGSQYDGAGNLLSGPATAGLRHYSTIIQGMTIIIDA
jgi:Rieske Fe-S protein